MTKEALKEKIESVIALNQGLNPFRIVVCKHSEGAVDFLYKPEESKMYMVTIGNKVDVFEVNVQIKDLANKLSEILVLTDSITDEYVWFEK